MGKKEKFEYDGKMWDVESNHTVAQLSTTFLRNGVARHEVIVKEGMPSEIETLVVGKKHKVLYAWNIKVLTREVLNKDGFVKFRETATIQAEGIRGEGKRFENGESTELGPDAEGIVDTDVQRVKRKATEAGKKLGVNVYLLAVAVIALLAAIVAAIVRLVKH